MSREISADCLLAFIRRLLTDLSRANSRARSNGRRGKRKGSERNRADPIDRHNLLQSNRLGLRGSLRIRQIAPRVAAEYTRLRFAGLASLTCCGIAFASASQIPEVVRPQDNCVSGPSACLHSVCEDAALRELVANWRRLPPPVSFRHPSVVPVILNDQSGAHLGTTRRERVIDQHDVAAINRHRRGSKTLYSSICGSSQPSCPKTFIARG